jgi:probable O-glycosylation ligase (exosortase A-associated)
MCIIPCIPLSLARPFFGLLVWTIIAFTSIHKFTYGDSAKLPWAVMIGVPTILGFVLFTRSWDRLKSRESVLILVLWIWFFLTSLGSTRTPLFLHHAVDTWDHMQFVSKIFLMTLITMGLVDSFSRLRKLVMVIACCFGFFVVKALPFLILTSGNDRVYGPPNSMIADNNDFGLAMNMTVPLFLFLAQSEKKPWLKRLFGGLFLMAIPVVFFTYSRGALLGLIAVLGMMMLQVKQKKVLIPVVILGIAIAVLFAPQAWKTRMNPTGEQALDKSAQSRINAWTFAWNLVSDYPIAGGGFGTFTRPLFIIYAPDPRDVHGPHSVYFGILGEHGFVGLFLYLLLVGSALYSTSEVIRWAKQMGDEVAMQYARMFRYSMVGFLVSGFFLGRQYFDYIYTILACIVVVKRLSFDAWREGRLIDSNPNEEVYEESEEDSEDEEAPVDIPGFPGPIGAGAR